MLDVIMVVARPCFEPSKYNLSELISQKDKLREVLTNFRPDQEGAKKLLRRAFYSNDDEAKIIILNSLTFKIKMRNMLYVYPNEKSDKMTKRAIMAHKNLDVHTRENLLKFTMYKNNMEMLKLCIEDVGYNISNINLISCASNTGKLNILKYLVQAKQQKEYVQSYECNSEYAHINIFMLENGYHKELELEDLKKITSENNYETMVVIARTNKLVETHYKELLDKSHRYDALYKFSKKYQNQINLMKFLLKYGEPSKKFTSWVIQHNYHDVLEHISVVRTDLFSLKVAYYGCYNEILKLLSEKKFYIDDAELMKLFSPETCDVHGIKVMCEIVLGTVPNDVEKAKMMLEHYDNHITQTLMSAQTLDSYVEYYTENSEHFAKHTDAIFKMTKYVIKRAVSREDTIYGGVLDMITAYVKYMTPAQLDALFVYINKNVRYVNYGTYQCYVRGIISKLVKKICIEYKNVGINEQCLKWGDILINDFYNTPYQNGKQILAELGEETYVQEEHDKTKAEYVQIRISFYDGLISNEWLPLSSESTLQKIDDLKDYDEALKYMDGHDTNLFRACKYGGDELYVRYGKRVQL
jgi:hypothetical protein